jgi:hypothetical protein
LFHVAAFPGFGQLVAISVEVQRVVGNGKIQNVSGHVLYLLYARVAEFENAPTVLTDQMVVLRILVRSFKMGNVLPELMLCHQFAVKKQFYCVVQSGSAYSVILFLHLHV